MVRPLIHRIIPIHAFLVCPILLWSQTPVEQMLYDFEGGFNIGSVVKNDAQVVLTPQNGGNALQVTLGHASQWPGITFNAATPWDLSTFQTLAMDIRNSGAAPICIYALADNDNTWPTNSSVACVNPTEVETLTVTFYRNTPPGYMAGYLSGMNGLPGGYVWHWEILNLTQIRRINIYSAYPTADFSFTVDNIRASEAYQPPTQVELTSGFFPFVDALGQYNHKNWTGKAQSTADITAQHQSEIADLAAHPGPTEWDPYGGWMAGPQLTATGHFRTQKYSGKWWLVDPDGRLFWSQGIDCVSPWQSTPNAGRTNYFTAYPPNGDFLYANLQQKFGTGNGWSTQARNFIQQRLRSWGINSVGNWSDAAVYNLRKTPYVVNLASGIAKDLPTTLDEATFRATLPATFTTAVQSSKDDPWCLGYFVDNELNWPATNPDLVSNTYYRVVSEELKKVAPDKLYLGSRIHTGPEAVYRAAAAYCDVVSHNRYEYTTANFALPSGVDKPVLIGEFHFGALDRGLLHTGLRAVGNQKQRARAYANYVNQAVDHVSLVGVHWFQYSDNVVSGRSDGENYQVGFVDIADRPYPQMVAAARELGDTFYPRRLNGSSPVRKQIVSPGLQKSRLILKVGLSTLKLQGESFGLTGKRKSGSTSTGLFILRERR